MYRAITQAEASGKQLCKLNTLQKNKPQGSCQPAAGPHSPPGETCQGSLMNVRDKHRMATDPKGLGWRWNELVGEVKQGQTFPVPSWLHLTQRSQRRSSNFCRKIEWCVYVYVRVCISISMHVCTQGMRAGIGTCMHVHMCA